MYNTAAAPTPPSMLDPLAYNCMEAVFVLLYAMAASSSWCMSVINGAVQDVWRWVGWIISISPAFKPWDCSRLWSGDLNHLIGREALWIWGCNGWSGGRDNNCNVALNECFSIVNLIGSRSACAARKSVAVDCIAPIMWRAVMCWTLASLFKKPTDPEVFLLWVWLLVLLWWMGVNHMSAAYVILWIVTLM